MQHFNISEGNRNSSISAALWVWFGIGTITFLCFPALRGRDPFWGWLPFWLLIAPLLDLALLHRGRLIASSRSFLIRHAHRRRRMAQQARRLRTRRLSRPRVQPLTANP